MNDKKIALLATTGITGLALTLLLVPVPRCAGAEDTVTATIEQGLKQLRAGSPDQALLTVGLLARGLARQGDRPRELALAYLVLSAALVEREEEVRASAFLREAGRLDPELARNFPRLPARAQAFCAAHLAELPLLAAPAATPLPPRSGPAPTPASTSYRPPPPQTRGSGAAGPALGVLGILAAGGGGAALGYFNAPKGEEGTTVTSPPPPGGRNTDDDGDGLSEAQGDCDDTNRRVHPGGPITLTGPFSSLDPAVSCREVDYETVVLTNHSCRTVSVASIRLSLVLLHGPCTGGTHYLTVSERDVEPGASRAIADHVRASATTGIGCCGGPCGEVTCEFESYIAVTTNAGVYEAPGYRFGVYFGDCARCSSLGLLEEKATCSSEAR